MKKKKKFLKDKRFLHTGFDLNLLLVILFLNVFGIIMIYSASYYYAESAYHYASNHFFINQLMWVGLGLALMYFVSFIRPGFYSSFWLIALIACLGLCVAVRIPGFGWSSHGAYRWIKFGSQTIQIAEPVKICFIIFLAAMLSRKDLTSPKNYLTIFGVSAAVSGMLLILSNNMSTAMIVFGMMYFTMMVAYPKPKWLIIIFFAGCLLVLLAVLSIKHLIPFDPSENFRITRIRAWLDPSNPDYADDQAYQATQALYAIASGGFWGKGLGQSLIKFRLPEPHNDYILAIIFEELGIFGVLLLTFLFVYLLYKIYEVYMHAKDRFSKAVTLGVFFHLAIQILLNYAVTIGFLPTMGVTLPFISAGGSSAFFTLAELGVILAISRQNNEDKLYAEAKAEAEEQDPYLKQLNQENYARYLSQKRRKRKRTAG